MKSESGKERRFARMFHFFKRPSVIFWLLASDSHKRDALRRLLTRIDAREEPQTVPYAGDRRSIYVSPDQQDQDETEMQHGTLDDTRVSRLGGDIDDGSPPLTERGMTYHDSPITLPLSMSSMPSSPVKMTPYPLGRYNRARFTSGQSTSSLVSQNMNSPAWHSDTPRHTAPPLWGFAQLAPATEGTALPVLPESASPAVPE